MTNRDNVYFASEGKVFQRISDSIIVGYGIQLGENDAIENYTEVDAPVEGDASAGSSVRYDAISSCTEYASGRKYVNFAGKRRWLNPAERANYKNALEAAKSLGVAEVPIYGVTLTPDMGLQILAAVEVYAMMVTLRSQQHQTALKALATDAEIEAYDYTAGYPEILTF